jgi:hypothetical protein
MADSFFIDARGQLIRRPSNPNVPPSIVEDVSLDMTSDERVALLALAAGHPLRSKVERAATGGGGGSGGVPTTSAAGTSIVLDSTMRVYDPLTVTGPTTITVTGSTKGARAQIVVVADGTNVPTISGATEWANSFGYLNAAGIPNLLDLEHNGLMPICAWSQAAVPGAVSTPAPPPPTPAPPAPTPPAPAPPAVPGAVQSLAAGTPTASTIPLTWSAPATGGAPTDYVVQYAAAGTSFASPTTFADGTSATTGATITGLPAATALDVRVAALNGTGTGPYASVLNVSTAAAPSGGQAGTPVTFAGTAYLSSLGGELYEATSFGTNFSARGWVTETLAGDGWVEVQYPNNTNVSTIFGLDAAAAGDTITYGQMDFTVVMAGSGGVSAGSNTTTFGTAVTTLTPSATTRVRIRREGSTLMVETTTDDWATATLRHTFSTTSSATLSARWFTSYSGTAKRICQPRASGLA